MLNEERVRLMTKMAMFEKREGKNIAPILNYTKKDYVSSRKLFAFLIGTVLYCGIFGVIVAALFFTVIKNIDRITLLLILLVGLIGYLLFIYLYLLIVQRRASRRYKRENRKLEIYRRAWDALESLYEREEQDKAPKMATMDSDFGDTTDNEDTLGN
jgi:beta-lactamase regulating signal transducer with metallopeptidase domain